jgi:hypothetical protein
VGTVTDTAATAAAAAAAATAEAAADRKRGIRRRQERIRKPSTKNQLKGNRQSTPGDGEIKMPGGRSNNQTKEASGTSINRGQ